MIRNLAPRPLATGIAALLVLVTAGFAAYWSSAPPERTCLSCHELQPAFDAWSGSAHRNIDCKECHGGSFSSVHSLQENAKRLAGHVTKPYHDDMGLSEAQVLTMVQRCRSCHRSEYAGWRESGHSVNYASIFLHPEHNAVEPPNNDCLRCHGMFYEGGIESLVAPQDTTDFWHLVEPERASDAVIPCLACHAVHVEGAPSGRYDAAEADTAAMPAAVSFGFYDRREELFLPATRLPMPDVHLDGDTVTVAEDPRQRLCVQCHAPNAAHQAGSSDDRTPRGVHRGLSCSACHEGHDQDTRSSCSNCHPALNNCGLEVEKMNTTFRTPSSPHDIHTVACRDCHRDAVPSRP